MNTPKSLTLYFLFQKFLVYVLLQSNAEANFTPLGAKQVFGVRAKLPIILLNMICFYNLLRKK